GINWYSEPFLGVMTSSTLIVNGTRPLGGENWPGLAAGLNTNDQILKLDDVSFAGVDNPGGLLNQELGKRRFGQEVTVEVFRPTKQRVPSPECTVYTSDGATCAYTYRLEQFPFGDFLIQFGLGFAVAVILLVIGGVLWALRRHQPAARLGTAMCAALAYVAMG